ncbi:MAG TPA: hypothetical protein VK533_16820 [Sphingomonas sp.]|uniref:hypothetical protein n=1 Tax=Sphingomonas sp. TaxID=28214 RepID=UPI002CD34E5A|nr:hypothetical protein [Sphingomonas sp.]HMI21197.1 hypothetical protein [Sphingomonas sp.]
MRPTQAALIAVALLSATGCHKVSDVLDTSERHHGRYAGIGIFDPGKIWTHLQRDPTTNPAAATPEDDNAVIVVVDSDTGEIRECGNYSGRCVSMNPWTKAIAPQQHMPVTVDAHAAELDRYENATDLEEPQNAAAKSH